MIKVYNSLSRKKEPFVPWKRGEVRFYSCGPTTYDLLHVGNARALIVGDFVFRIFSGLGFKTVFVRNFTDVDDKIVQRARELSVDALQHSQKYIAEALRDMASLGMLPPTYSPKVSEMILEVIQFIAQLIDKGYAYVSEGEVLFHAPSFKKYGELSGRDLKDLDYGHRVEVGTHKKHPADFVLWKPVGPSYEGPSWKSPWGEGRPGWHIECSTMGRAFLGKRFDLHHGGIDLMFPHHENEIAQSESANQCRPCRYWIHNELVNFKNQKMSKSLQNVVTIRSFVKTYGGKVLRQLLSSVHYRSPLNWSSEAIERAISETERMHKFLKRIREERPGKKEGDFEKLAEMQKKIKEALGDDFNIPKAMGFFFVVIKDFNRDFQGVSPTRKTLNTLRRMSDFFSQTTGLLWRDHDEVLREVQMAKRHLKKDESKAGLSSKEVQKLIEVRKKARAQKDWGTADQVRKRLLDAGISLKDNPDGSVSWDVH